MPPRGGSATTPYLPKQIEIDAGPNVAGQEIRVYNTNTGEVLRDIAGGSGELLVELSSTTSGWTEGDVLLIKTNGDYFGSTTLTLDGTGGQSVSVSVTQATTTNTVGLR